MFGKIAGEKVYSQSDKKLNVEEAIKESITGEPDVGVLVSVDKEDDRVAVLIWHYYDYDIAGPSVNVRLEVGGLK